MNLVHRGRDVLRFATALLCLTISDSAFADEPWPLHVIDDSSRGADGVRLADVNGDGRADIATGWEEGGITRAYLNPGPKRATSKWPAVTVGRTPSVEDAVFVDLDGDGATDVVSCSEGGTQTVFVHWAPRDRSRYLDPNAWTRQPLPASVKKTRWMFCLPMQIDGEHGIDLVCGSKNPGGVIGWFRSPENPRDLAAWTFHPMTSAGWVMSLIRSDVDGDGRDDVLFTDRRGPGRGIGWLRNPGRDWTQPWSRNSIAGADREVMFLAEGDLDGDVHTDLVTAVRGGGFLVAKRVPGRTPKWTTETVPIPDGTGTGKAARLADVNGDGRTDLVFTCENAAGKHGAMWLERTRTAWQPHPLSGRERGIKYDRIELLDLDADGDLDLLTCEEREGGGGLGAIWYENPDNRR